jgi:hypothetical protein
MGTCQIFGSERFTYRPTQCIRQNNTTTQRSVIEARASPKIIPLFRSLLAKCCAFLRIGFMTISDNFSTNAENNTKPINNRNGQENMSLARNTPGFNTKSPRPIVVVEIYANQYPSPNVTCSSIPSRRTVQLQ